MRSGRIDGFWKGSNDAEGDFLRGEAGCVTWEAVLQGEAAGRVGVPGIVEPSRSAAGKLEILAFLKVGRRGRQVQCNIDFRLALITPVCNEPTVPVDPDAFVAFVRACGGVVRPSAGRFYSSNNPTMEHQTES